MSSLTSSQEFVTPRVHLIFTSLITNRAINSDLSEDVSNDLYRLNQYFSSIHSMASLSLDSQIFYLELGAEFAQYRHTVADYTKEIFPNSMIFWERLSNYQDWLNSSDSIPASSNLVLLQSNFDHAYVNPSPFSFLETCQHLLVQEKRSVAEITHWPEALSEISGPWGAIQNMKVHPNYFTRDTKLAVGTTLVRKEFFKEWWRSDFTYGSKIVRPDNPFGPSVKFPNATLIIPQAELFRHMDGYTHVGIRSQFAQKLEPCCEIKNLSIDHKDWRRLTFNQLVNCKESFDILPDVDELIGNIPVNVLMTASAHRIDLGILSTIARHNNYLDLDKEIRHKIIRTLLQSRYHRKMIYRMIFEKIFVGLLLQFFHVTENPRNSELLSEIMSHGTARGFNSWLIRRIRRKLKKFLKSFR